MEKDGACKMDRQNKKNAGVLERVGEGRIMLELRKKRKINFLGHWLRRNCLLKVALEGMVNGKNIRGRRRYMIDNIMINGLFVDKKRKAEKRVEWRMLRVWSERPALGQKTMINWYV